MKSASFRSFLVAFGFFLGLCCCCWRPAFAGGGAENVLLVVNGDDEPSRMVANWYQRLRNIPDSNVLFLRGISRSNLASFKEGKELIVMPIIAAIQQRKLDGQIDYVVFSSGFPTQVEIDDYSTKFIELWNKSQAENDGGAARVFSNRASLTSFTYFFAHIIGDNPSFLGPGANNYFRKPVGMAMQQPFGGPPQESYDKAVQAIRSGNGSEAIGLLEKLAQDNPGHMIVNYRLAQAHAANSAPGNAAKSLINAQRAGWCYREFTRTDPSMQNVIENPLVAGIVQRLPDEAYELLPTTGNSSRYRWGPGGIVNNQDGQGLPYLMCTMLGTNWDFGNSEEEIIGYLRSSAAADFSRPSGKFFFSITSDVRTITREPNFKAAIDRLTAMGHKAEIGKSILPHNETIAGATIGAPTFSWQTSACTILPGAICENFTSYGGDFTQPSQTKLSELLRFGAAGSSGTVTEPFALQFKFPDPMIHVHYARGCSLAESFYQSLSGPFQLVIIGDALCQPWAIPPKPVLTGLTPNSTVKGQNTVKISAEDGSVPFNTMEVYFDGRLVARHGELKDVHFDSAKMSDGYHDLRVVVIDTTPIQTRASRFVPFVVDNSGQKVRIEAKSNKVPVGEWLELTISSTVGEQVEVVHCGEMIGSIKGRDGKLQIKAVRVGRGPSRIFAIAKDDAGRTVSSEPLDIEITGSLSTEPVTVLK